MRALLFALLLLQPEDAVQKRCGELSESIEKLLGPKFKAPVPVKVVDEKFITEFAKRVEEQQMPEPVREVTQRLYARLGLVPPGFDVSNAQLDLLAVSVAGLYDPDNDCYYVVANKARVGTPGFDVTAVHELAHAYRDVDKDYWARIVRSFKVDEDRAIAISCLVEGDATLVGNVVGRGWEPAKAVEQAKQAPGRVVAAMADPRLRKFPLFLREMLLTRYFIGQAFAARLYEKGGWAALDKAYDEPPLSSEQILHPEKYGVDRPTRIEGGEPGAALGEGWKVTYSNTVGEFMIRVQFTEPLSRKAATSIAAGWDGALLHVCERAGAPMFIGLITVWDSEEDAREFAMGWEMWAGMRDEPKQGPRAGRKLGKERRVWTKDGLVVVLQDGNRVLVADGVPPEKAGAVMDALGSAKLIP